MNKINTFFAAATWYDDDDSEHHVLSRHREPLRGRRCASGGMDSHSANLIDKLDSAYKKI